jgi:hypothetical protein
MQEKHAADVQGKPDGGRKYHIVDGETNCRHTLERHPGETEFVYEQADILVNSFFGQPNVSLKVLQCINEMKAEAAQTKQRMEQEAHRLDMELRQAGVPHTHNVQNLFGSNAVKGEGNMNVGGGTISL